MTLRELTITAVSVTARAALARNPRWPILELDLKRIAGTLIELPRRVGDIPIGTAWRSASTNSTDLHSVIRLMVADENLPAWAKRETRAAVRC